MKQGLCKAIGISNFTIKKITNLLETANIVPACNQGLMKKCIHLYLQYHIKLLLLDQTLPTGNFEEEVVVS